MTTFTTPAPVIRRPIVLWDIILTAVLLVVILILLALSAVFDLFAVLFIDHCPPTTCNAGGAIAAVSIAWVVMFLVAIAGSIGSIVLLVKRRRAWWVALTTIVIVALAWIGGGLLWAGALNHTPDVSPELSNPAVSFSVTGNASPS